MSAAYFVLILSRDAFNKLAANLRGGNRSAILFGGNIVKVIDTDVLVIGTGGAGLYAAIRASEAGQRVTILDKGLVGRSGGTVSGAGVSAVGPWSEPDDSVDVHFRDTVVGGSYLSDQPLVRVLTSEAQDRVREMESWGLCFDKKPDGRYVSGPCRWTQLSACYGHQRSRGAPNDKGAACPACSARVSIIIPMSPQRVYLPMTATSSVPWASIWVMAKSSSSMPQQLFWPPEVSDSSIRLPAIPSKSPGMAWHWPWKPAPA